MYQKGLLLLFIFTVILLAACGVNNDDTTNDKTEANESQDNEDEGGGRISCSIAFAHEEDPDDISDAMASYLEDKGCELEVSVGRTVCDTNDTNEIFEGTTFNIGDNLSDITIEVQE